MSQAPAPGHDLAARRIERMSLTTAEMAILGYIRERARALRKVLAVKLRSGRRVTKAAQFSVGGFPHFDQSRVCEGLAAELQPGVARHVSRKVGTLVTVRLRSNT